MDSARWPDWSDSTGRLSRVWCAPKPAESALAALVGVVLGGVALTGDLGGRFLGLVAGTGLVVLAVGDFALRPRLVADADGVSVRSYGRMIRYPWPAVDTVRVDERQRLGLRSRTLEVEAGDRLFLFGRRTLGADPMLVAEALTALRR